MKRILVMAAAAFAVLAHAQSFPGSKPITFVVPFAAGGPTDRVARDLAKAMRKAMQKMGMHHVTFVIENVNGAGGTIGAAKVAKAAPDGHTLLIHHIGMAAAPGLYRRLPYNTLDDFEYLGLVSEVPMTIISKPQMAASNYGELQTYIRANSGKLNIAHAGLGSASHLCGLMWQAAINANVPMTTIPFGGTAPAMSALVSGQVDLMCDQSTNTAGQIEAGRVKAYAVTSATPLVGNKLLGDYPALAQVGLKGFELTIWHGLYAPKGTPQAVLTSINDALKLALKDPEFNRKQHDLGAVVVRDERVEPAAHKAFVAAEIAKLKPVIEAAGKYAD